MTKGGCISAAGRVSTEFLIAEQEADLRSVLRTTAGERVFSLSEARHGGMRLQKIDVRWIIRIFIFGFDVTLHSSRHDQLRDGKTRLGSVFR